MRFVSAVIGDKNFVGLIDKDNLDNIIDLKKVGNAMGSNVHFYDSMLECLNDESFIANVSKVEKWLTEQQDKSDYLYKMESVKLLAPIPRPSKNIFCIGKNYAAHAIEMGSAADIPEHPMVFSKVPTTVIAHEEDIPNHKEVTDELDYEGELAVVIGKKGKGITEAEAMDYVFGYTILNDVTARDMQKRHKQFLLGKSLDGSCPMGPAIIHSSLIENPNKLDIETRVNGEVRQSANTDQFIFDIPKLISTISKGTTLEVGDVIATGTPSGVGKGFKPPRFLKPGDVVEITIEKVGTLRNKIEE